MNSEADAGTEHRETQQPIKLVEEPKIFRDQKGKEMVHDAKRLNSIKRPNDLANKDLMVKNAGEKSEKSMVDESFSDYYTEEDKP